MRHTSQTYCFEHPHDTGNEVHIVKILFVQFLLTSRLTKSILSSVTSRGYNSYVMLPETMQTLPDMAKNKCLTQKNTLH